MPRQGLNLYPYRVLFDDEVLELTVHQKIHQKGKVNLSIWRFLLFLS